MKGSFETILEVAEISGFRFHDLRHTFASWYMMNGGDLYELAKILGHSNIKMTERYAKLGKTPHGEDGRHRARDLEAVGDRYPHACQNSSASLLESGPRVISQRGMHLRRPW